MHTSMPNARFILAFANKSPFLCLLLTDSIPMALTRDVDKKREREKKKKGEDDKELQFAKRSMLDHRDISASTLLKYAHIHSATQWPNRIPIRTRYFHLPTRYFHLPGSRVATCWLLVLHIHALHTRTTTKGTSKKRNQN